MTVMERIKPHLTRWPVNIEQAIRDCGIKLNKNAKLPEGIAGHVRTMPDGSYEIASSSSDHYYRQRFTLAHELGHYVLHKSMIGSGVDDDRKYRSTELGDLYNTKIDEFHERQANAFAASILMPESLLTEYIKTRSEEISSMPDLADMAKAFQVSTAALRWRLKNVGLEGAVYDPD